MISLAHRAAAGALVALAIAAATQQAGAQAAAQSPTQVVVELRLGTYTSVTGPAFRVGDEALLPLSALLRLAEIRHTLQANGTLEATVQPGNLQLVIGALDASARFGNRRVVVPPELRLLRGGDLYVGAGPLGQLLGLDIKVDWPDLTVTIRNAESLPVSRRIARERARQGVLARTEPTAVPVLRHALGRPPIDGLVLDYMLSAPGADPFRAGTYAFNVGMNVFGGSLEGSIAGAGMALTRSVRSTGSWTGVWANPWLRQLRLGDAVSTGLSPRLFRGVSVSNSPYLRRTQFGLNAFDGLLQRGWEVEAYRSGQLIAFTSADEAGRYALEVPTHYGENPLDFVAYGPFGEVRSFSRLYRIPNELIPAGQFEYGVSAGACAAVALQRCTETGNVDFRYGISQRWTVRAGYDGFRRDTLGIKSHPYAGIAGAVTDAIGILVEGTAGATARAVVRFEPSTRLRLAAEYAHFDTVGSAQLLLPAGWRSRVAVSALVRPKGFGSSTYIEGDARHVQTITGTMSYGRLITSADWRGVRVSPYARFERTTDALTDVSRSFFGLSTWIFSRPGWGRLLSNTWLRSAVEIENAAGLSEASVTLSRQLRRGVRIEAGGRWTRTAAAATLATAIDLGVLRSYTSVLVPKTGTPTTGEFVQGSVVLNTVTKGIEFTSSPSLQRSGVAGRVFLDGNGNGLFDIGERLLPNVTLRVGTVAAASDPQGWFEAWNVVPFEPTVVSVDSTTLPSPLWIPTFAAVSVIPGPNRFSLVDVPIVPGGAVEGRVVLETAGGHAPVGNARLTLVEHRSGTRHTVTTFNDGEFLTIGLRPGDYQVIVDEQLLGQLRAAAVATGFTLAAAPDGATVKGVEVVLRRTGPRRDD